MKSDVTNFGNVQTMIMHKDLFASMNIVITPSMEVRTLFDGDMLIIEDKNLSKQSRINCKKLLKHKVITKLYLLAFLLYIILRQKPQSCHKDSP